MRKVTISPPRFHQGQIDIYHGLGRRNVLRCGRRWGKSTLLEGMATQWSLKHGYLVGVFAPDYGKLLPSFRNLLRLLKPVTEHASKVDKIITLKNGGEIEFFSLTDEGAGRGRKFHRVLIDEASLYPGEGMKEIWEQAISPTLLDFGGSAVVAGTPQGINPENWFWQISHNIKTPEHWKTFHAPTFSNPMLPADELASLEARYHPLVFRQEFLAEFIDWTGVAFFSLDNLTDNGQGVRYPGVCEFVGACIDTAVKDGVKHDGSAVVYYARSMYAGTPLVILDWDTQQIKGNYLTDWLPTVFERLDQLAVQCGALHGSAGVWIEDKASGSVLIQEGQDRGWPIQPIPGAMTAMGKNERAMACSGPVHRNEVRISQHALDKRVMYKEVEQNHLISQFCGFQIDDPKAYKRADDLADAAMYAILTTLSNDI